MPDKNLRTFSRFVSLLICRLSINTELPDKKACGTDFAIDSFGEAKNFMTTVVHKENWKDFFDELNREKSGWSTSVEFFSNTSGIRVLDSNMCLRGLNFDQSSNDEKIEIMAENEHGNVMSYRILNPKFIAFEFVRDKNVFILDIENSDEEKMLIAFTLTLS